MRITNSILNRNYLKNLNTSIGQLSDCQQKMVTGRRFMKGREDVGGAARAMSIRSSLADAEKNKLSLDMVNARISASESNMMSAKDVLVNVQEQLKKGMTGDKADQRGIVSEQIKDLREQMMTLANGQFSDKNLFGGTQNSEAPFKYTNANPAVLQYNGIPVADIQKDDDGYFYMDGNGVRKEVPYENNPSYVDVGMGLTMNGGKVDPRTALQTSLSGLDIFGYGDPTANPPTGPGNIMEILKRAEDGLVAVPYDDAAMVTISHAVDARFEDIMLNVAEIGTRSRFAEMTELRLDSDIENLIKLQQKVEFAEDTETVMQLKNLQKTWQVTLQFGNQVIPQSIFDYMR